MLLLASLLVSLLSTTCFVSAHKEPKTPEEIQVQRALQAAAYYCSPAVDQFTAVRKRAWARKINAGQGELPSHEKMFLNNMYEISQGSLAVPARLEDDDIDMGCTPISTTEIQNNTCVLAPEVAEGPYWHEVGHPIRQNIADYQDGLLLLLDIGVIDVETCKPLPNALVDLWQTNATGDYSGHPAVSRFVNNNPLPPSFPRTLPEETWLRGAWPTDENGVAQFTTIFPGYYQGRATHIHTKVFPEWKVLKNNTFMGSRVVHVGQFFFDDEINTVVDKMHPYTENPIAKTWGRTPNWRDSYNIFEDAIGPEGKYNPIFKMHLLGGVVRQGLIGYITMGVNASAKF
ncbi:hypothetical protein AGABI1DRAFT_129968 [Agaricus bisporus var. burnettii JB137-S8]|uniref:Intradiol ring-cleavage dioxygenases domain-containing protein n=1 Tax=Agaricus bisporus var. burnettii (strain JB137-S8 / ATCC MYA-4627 / FGSC 10392) TaxID=597362 RepID=K5X3E6_AGABU|nr:uncharacterized protein AGABI1DRAFT_129968 [Agaricus bisporus var. burnettii JB137-S8]EKM77683.1 hypothetical protein AGABI1DRAFT_129968 [Agaricus bisporus var. burnettii JB137-S8]